MVQNKVAVEGYFDREAWRFEGIYTSANRGLLQKSVDRLFRTRMLRRRNIVVANMIEVGANCLDVGCGSGRTAIELVRTRGATVHGIDLSEPILLIARENVVNMALSNWCSFEQADILDWSSTRLYDVVIGVGLLDYFDDPLPFLQKAAQIAEHGSLVISYSVSWRILNVARRIWLSGLHRCPVRFYSHGEIDALARRLGGRVEERRISGGQWPFINDAVAKITLN